MMKTETYFNKYGVIYGVSSKFDFGRWNHYLKVFDSFEKAIEWLYTEEYDFRERELCSKSEAIKLLGKKGFEESVKYNKEWR